MKHHIYEVDAIQISTSKEVNCNLLLSADADLVRIAKKEEVNALNIEVEPEQALTIIGQT